MDGTAGGSLAAAAARSGCDAQTLDRIAAHLEGLHPSEAARINPFTFSADAGVSTERALDLFVHGARLGVFDLEWGTVCPMCGAITHSAAALDHVASDVVHCCLCNKDADAVLDDTVEVTFAYAKAAARLDIHADYAAYQQYFTSSSYPHRDQWRNYHQRHRVADVKLAPGEEGSVALTLAAGETYRLISFDIHAGADIRVDPDGKTRNALTLSDSGFSVPGITASAGESTLRLTNRTDQPVWCHIFRMVYDEVMEIIKDGTPVFGERLTGKHLLNNQAFRETFALHELAPDLKLKLRSLTLLFTDLKGSTALYDREGDLAAYRLVQDHFVALKKVVRGHSGALIKTMGDAVMAAFPTGDDGVSAAIDMMQAMDHVTDAAHRDDVGLKVGLHTGPALAINAGQTVDYFGQTVNIAARVQGLADAGDICVTGALNDDDAVPALLTASGYAGRAEQAMLKGVSTAETVYRYRMLG